MDNSNNYYEMSDKALIGQIGTFLQETRLSQNKTQLQVATAAGINRSTLVQLEHGRGGTLMSLIQVLRVLQQLHIFAAFELQQQISPLLLAKMEQHKRKRVRNKGTDEANTQVNW
jgi:transcriptional regulator with XRE-family HTH domain